MEKKTSRERVRKRHQRERLHSRIIWGGIVVGVLVLGGTLILRAVRPAAGEAFPIMPSSRHIPVGEDPRTFNSDPPTSGLITMHHWKQVKNGANCLKIRYHMQ